MAKPALAKEEEIREVDLTAVLNALGESIVVMDGANRIHAVNQAAEQFFQRSESQLRGAHLEELVPRDSQLLTILDQVRRDGGTVSEHGVSLLLSHRRAPFVAVRAARMAENTLDVVLALEERSIARRIDHQLTHRNAARSVTAMAAMLAHEIKNPLSGIRGAAQLLDENATEDDRELTRLICEETDRVAAVVDRMEMFSSDPPIEREPVNIHEILEHVRRLAESGSLGQVGVEESYDPSLPPVYGNRTLLVQMMLNLVKNAVEAVSANDGEKRVLISTGYTPGVRLTVPGSDQPVSLPLTVMIEDNGPGIPSDLHAHLFDPFVTTKPGGKGLGLALVAKLVGDHGGIVEFESEPGRTRFKVSLPMVPRGVRRS